jgi:hypothetical protein
MMYESIYVPILSEVTYYKYSQTSPIWVFCRQDAGTPASHCRKGMVFAINPGAAGSNNSYLAFQKAAEATATS